MSWVTFWDLGAQLNAGAQVKGIRLNSGILLFIITQGKNKFELKDIRRLEVEE